MLPLVLAALLGICALLVVLAPIFAHTDPAMDATDAATTTTALAERERAAKAALRDVEFDHQLGNLADDDYQGLRERYTRRALAALKGRYDRERALDDAIEAQVRALRDAAPPAVGPGSSASTALAPDPRPADADSHAARAHGDRRQAAPHRTRGGGARGAPRRRGRPGNTRPGRS